MNDRIVIRRFLVGFEFLCPLLACSGESPSDFSGVYEINAAYFVESCQNPEDFVLMRLLDGFETGKSRIFIDHEPGSRNFKMLGAGMTLSFVLSSDGHFSGKGIPNETTQGRFAGESIEYHTRVVNPSFGRSRYNCVANMHAKGDRLEGI